MSLTRLLNQELTVLRYNPSALDDYNNEVPDWESDGTVRGYVEQTQSTEVTRGEQTVVSDWQATLLGFVDLTPQDRLQRGSLLLEVASRPDQKKAGRNAVTQVRCRSVE